jgi:hypothetical protein
MDEKTCTQCGAAKPLTEFHRNARAADGHRAECKVCNRASLQSKYVPRVHEPERMVCPQCDNPFTRVRTQGQPRVYCSRKCTMAAAEDRRLARATALGPRHCPCGTEVMTPVGKPVCPDCRKDPRPDAQVRERTRTLRAYGLTQADWDALIERQGNRCAVCRTDKPGGRGERWHIDHDHVTGRTRGLLCHQCNVGIGNLRDDPEIIKAAARYVTEHRQLELGKAG